MGLISNGTTIFDAGTLNVAGSLTFMKKLTASNSATLSFVHGGGGVDFSTFKEYLFTFKNIHHSTDGEATFSFQGSIDAGSNYNVAITSTMIQAYHGEDGSGGAAAYYTGGDQAEGTGFQNLGTDLIDDNDSSASGKLLLFNPASTTFVKHFLATVNGMTDGSPPYTEVRYSAGYFNTTTALTRVQFKMDSGNIDVGDICLYGIS